MQNERVEINVPSSPKRHRPSSHGSITARPLSHEATNLIVDLLLRSQQQKLVAQQARAPVLAPGAQAVPCVPFGHSASIESSASPVLPPVPHALQKEQSQPKGGCKRRLTWVEKLSLYCHRCGKVDTPEWRKGPDGPATLCNACGLQWSASTANHKRRPRNPKVPVESKRARRNASKSTSQAPQAVTARTSTNSVPLYEDSRSFSTIKPEDRLEELYAPGAVSSLVSHWLCNNSSAQNFLRCLQTIHLSGSQSISSTESTPTSQYTSVSPSLSPRSSTNSPSPLSLDSCPSSPHCISSTFDRTASVIWAHDALHLPDSVYLLESVNDTSKQSTNQCLIMEDDTRDDSLIAHLRRIMSSPSL
ncbi:hypothetical protein Pelo_4705 [Pelomyxa schiedti]|nr:hypothetical protein Pelo_4705 [Pelomyxa schiedti]